LGLVLEHSDQELALPSKAETALDPDDDSDGRKPRKFFVHRPLVLLIAVLLAVGLFVPPVYLLYGKSVTIAYWKKPIGPGEPGWVPINQVSKHLLNAIVVAEDARFYEHIGIDVGEIYASIRQNMREKRYARGASTITQQTVKLSFLSIEKTLLRKGREAVGALLAEALFSKQRILEWYINILPLGETVIGVGQASQKYFGTRANLLSIGQAVNLAMILPNPTKWGLGLRKRALSPFGHRRFSAILTQMLKGGYITRDQWVQTMASGDFGRPIRGFDNWIAAKKKQDSVTLACTPESQDPKCLEAFTGDYWNESERSLFVPESDANSSSALPQPSLEPSDNATVPATDAAAAVVVPAPTPSAQPAPDVDDGEETGEETGEGAAGETSTEDETDADE
jgi:monofunctional biosynthetic peptidoglycan transglycosylase